MWQALLSRRRSRAGFFRLTLLGTGVVLLLLPATAFAGRLWATGHDADLHCNPGTNQQCHYLRTAVGYVRGAAPDPTKKVLVLDNHSLELDHDLTTFGIAHDTVDPRSPAFASQPINTATYSAVAVASDETCGGCDLNIPTTSSETPDSNAINARKADIAAFFNAGGGVLALAGAEHGGNSTTAPNVYYNFVPLPLGGTAVTEPFCLTSVGISLGLQDQSCPDASKHSGTNNDINCCATHNSFNLPPPGSAIQVAETDSAGKAETLAAEGTISGGTIKRPTSTSVSCTPSPVSVSKATTCKVTVTDTSGGTKTTPTGSVSLSSSGKGSLSATSCTLTAVSTGVASCSVTFKTGSVGSGKRTISASFPGDAGHVPSSGSTVVRVKAAAKKCVVPKLKGKTVAQARKLLKKHHCKLGKVTTKGGASKRTGKLHIVSQSVKAKSVHSSGKRVSVVIDRTGKPVGKLICETGSPDRC